MTKGHNKHHGNVKNEQKGGSEHLKDKKSRKHSPEGGRNAAVDQSGGTKGKNSI